MRREWRDRYSLSPLMQGVALSKCSTSTLFLKCKSSLQRSIGRNSCWAISKSTLVSIAGNRLGNDLPVGETSVEMNARKDGGAGAMGAGRLL